MTSAQIGTTLRRMTLRDVERVTRLQVAFLEGSVITELGIDFLRQFHRASLSHSSVQAFVATDASEGIVGFVQASTDVHGFNSFVTPRVLPQLAWALLVPRRWRLIPRFLIQAVANREPEPYIPAELLLLVVHPRARRQGLAQSLIASLEHDFSDLGIAHYRVAVRSQLSIARAFYLATGFAPEQEMKVLGASMTYLTKVVRT